MKALTFTEHDLANIRDLRPHVLDDDGRMTILPAAFWASTTATERAVFGQRTGIYSLPTRELVEHLKQAIGDRPAIEIGAGNGVLAQTLGIPATDTREQEKPAWRMILAMQGGAAPVPYGPNVVEMNAARAVRHFKPQVVIGCWVTQDYDPSTTWDHDSKADGIDEADIIDRAGTYIMIGNEEVHKGKRIWQRPHQISYPDFLYSRAVNGSREFIATWTRPAAASKPKPGMKPVRRKR